MEYKCRICDVIFSDFPHKKRIYCSSKCKIIGSVGPRKMNNKLKHSSGYLLLYSNEHPNRQASGPYIYEHRLVASRKIGRALLETEDVHHINHNKKDNRPENLLVVDYLTHHRLEKGWWIEGDVWYKNCTRCFVKMRVNEINFYFSKNGKYSAACKPCDIKRVRDFQAKHK